MKKKIIIAIIILGVIALLIGIYLAWKKSRQIVSPGTTLSPLRQLFGGGGGGGENGNNLSEGNIGDLKNRDTSEQITRKLKVLSDQPIFDYWVYSPNSTSSVDFYYFNKEGKIYKVKDGDDKAIIKEPLAGLQYIKPQKGGQKVIIKSGSRTFPNFKIFDIETKIFESMPAGTTAATWSSDGQNMAYLQTNGGKSDLIIESADYSKLEFNKIISFSGRDYDLAWPSAEKIFLIPKPSAFYETFAWAVDIKDKTISPAARDSGLMVGWPGNGNAGLKFASRPERRENSFGLIDKQGLPLADLYFTSLPNKCFVSEVQLYCGVPVEIPENATLPDDYLKRAVFLNDTIYKIDLENNSTLQINPDSEIALDILNPTLNGNQFIFINRFDDKLYGLEL